MRHCLTLAALVVLGSSCSTDSSSGTSHPDSGGSSTGGADTGSGGTGTSSAGATTSDGGAGGSPGNGGRTAGASGNGAATMMPAGAPGNGGRNTGGRAAGGRGSDGASSGGTSGTGGQSDADAASPHLIDHYVTFYGWPDNDPAGNGIAYPGLHQGASGTGTYADPITFATDPKEWAPGTVLYVPYLKRYVIMEDSCADCITDWKSGKYHIDLWLDSDGHLDSQVLACENALTREKTAVEVDPPPDRTVDATPLFDLGTGKCNAP